MARCRRPRASRSGGAELPGSPGLRLLRGSLPALLGRRFAEAACGLWGGEGGRGSWPTPVPLLRSSLSVLLSFTVGNGMAASSPLDRHLDQK